AAAAQAEAVGGRTLRSLNSRKIDRAGDRVGTVLGDGNASRGNASRGQILNLRIVLMKLRKRIAQRPGRASFNRRNDRFTGGAVRIDPRLRAVFEDRRELVGAEASVGADRAVVMDNDASPLVGV